MNLRDGIVVEGTVEEMIQFVKEFEGSKAKGSKNEAQCAKMEKEISSVYKEPAKSEPSLIPKKHGGHSKGKYKNPIMQKFMDKCPYEHNTMEFNAYYGRGMAQIKVGNIPLPEGNRKKAETKTESVLKRNNPEVSKLEGAYEDRKPKPKQISDTCDFCFGDIPKGKGLGNGLGKVFCQKECRKNWDTAAQREYENDL